MSGRKVYLDRHRTKERAMSRVQLALRVSDLEGSIAFYSSLFGVEPAKRRRGYANFAVTEPALKLVLIEGEPDGPTVMDHLRGQRRHRSPLRAWPVHPGRGQHHLLLRAPGQGVGPRSRGRAVGGVHRQGRRPPTRPASIPSARTPPGSASAARRARRTASSRPAADRVTPVALHRRHLNRTALPGRANSRDRARSGLR